jgi:putative phosphonate metabolism protein
MRLSQKPAKGGHPKAEVEMEFKRYAIYYTAPKGAFADFGAAWLGWDLVSGTEVPHPEIAGLDAPISELTKTPRKYGFHATLKPPFRLAESQSFSQLKSETARICSNISAVTLDRLQVSRIGRFLALTPVGDESALNQLAASVVREFDPFRAPASEAELARRRAANLSPTQEQNLTKWGYPNVMEEFHFHMTLTGRLDKNHIETVETQLHKAITPHLPKPFEIRDLTLAGEAPDGQFHEIERFPLRMS